MGRRNKLPGLRLREGIWHIDKRYKGKRIRESTGTGDLEEAERYLARRIEQLRQVEVYGVRPERTLMEAATKYLREKEKATIAQDAKHLRDLVDFLGEIPLKSVHMGTLRPFMEHQKKKGLKKRTINYALQVIRHLLNLAAGEWLDENGMTWLQSAPKIKCLREDDKRKPYPLSWEEQDRLFAELPEHLREMALFAVNTGTRANEICRLRWDWEVQVPELDTSVFIIPDNVVKNREERLVVLNQIAAEVIERQRGNHTDRVFTFQGKPVNTFGNTAWKKARVRAGIPDIKVHDLKHTFGRRLRAGGVRFEDRQDLLGHKSGRITTHYSQAELGSLIAAANTVCEKSGHKMPTLLMLKRKRHLALVG
jgi:integrase